MLIKVGTISYNCHMTILVSLIFVVTRGLQVKVVMCFLLLGVGRAVNVLVPYMYKIIGEFDNTVHSLCTTPPLTQHHSFFRNDPLNSLFTPSFVHLNMVM